MDLKITLMVFKYTMNFSLKMISINNQLKSIIMLILFNN